MRIANFQLGRVLLWMACTAAFLHPAAQGLDPQKRITQYAHQSWGGDQGLNQSSILAIKQTKDGYLWLGTEEGVVRFDGVQFTVFDGTNTSAIKNNIVQALLEDHAGNFWIGTRGGVVREKDGVFKNFSIAEGLSNNLVASLAEDNNGDIWIGTMGGGVDRFHDGKFTAFTKAQGLANNTVSALYAARDGGVWVGTDGGLCRIANDSVKCFQSKEELGVQNVTALWQDPDGTLWVGATPGLYSYKDGKFAPWKEFAGQDVLALYRGHSGNLWVGTERGLYRIKAATSQVDSYTAQDGLVGDTIRSIFEDREGSLWIGTYTGILNRLSEGIFTTIGEQEGLANNFAYAVVQAKNGDMWFGTWGGGVQQLHNGQLRTFTTKDGLISANVRSLWQDDQGTIWVGTDRGVSRIFANGKINSITTRDGLSSDLVRPIYQDRQGAVWIGTDEGLNRIANGKITVFTVKDGLSVNAVYSIYEDQAGNLWIGTINGLDLFKDGKFIDFPGKSQFVQDFVANITEDPAGTLWIGTQASGIKRFQNGKVTSYTVRDGLFQNTAWKVVFDGQGSAWMGSNKGIYRVSRKELDDFAAAKIKSVHSTVYGTEDGLKSRECNGGESSAWRSDDGKIWFATMGGVAAVDPLHLQSNQLPPPVLVQQVRVNDAPVTEQQLARLPADSKRFEFHSAALSLLAPQKVQYQYRLSGFDKDWVSAENRRVAYYTNLPPGHYVFQVRASNNDGVWNQQGASVEFYLEPHFYQTYWFFALCLVGLIGAAFAFDRLRTARLRAHAMKLEGIVQARTRELRQHQDQLEEQVMKRTAELMEASAQLRQAQKMEALGRLAGGIAHDFNNLLTVITGYSTLLRDKLTGDQSSLDKVEQIYKAGQRASELTQQLLAFSRRQIVQQKTLNLNHILTDCDKMLQRILGEDIELKTSLAADLASIQADPGQITQVVVNLAVNARDAMPEGGTLTLTTANAVAAPEGKREGTYVLLVVRDTGCGMDAETKAHVFEPFFTTKGEAKGTGLGLATVYGIVEQAGGHIVLESEPNHGTTFQIYFPSVMAPASADARPVTRADVQGTETVLVVEDQEGVRTLVCEVLRKSGYQVIAAHDGKEALSLLEKHQGKLHLVITDVVMPQMGGPQLAKALGALHAESKVLYMSGYTDKASQAQIATAGLPFIQKPFTPEALVQRVREILDKPAVPVPPPQPITRS